MLDIGMSPDYRTGYYQFEFETCRTCDRPIHWTRVEYCAHCRQPLCPDCSVADDNNDTICPICAQSIEMNERRIEQRQYFTNGDTELADRD